MLPPSSSALLVPSAQPRVDCQHPAPEEPFLTRLVWLLSHSALTAQEVTTAQKLVSTMFVVVLVMRRLANVSYIVFNLGYHKLLIYQTVDLIRLGTVFSMAVD